MTAEELKLALMVSETEEQKKVFVWVAHERLNHPVLDLLVHIPNEGKRSSKAGANLKKMGLRTGFPDLIFPFACGGFGSLCIELKMPDEKLKKEQEEWAVKLNANGNLSVAAIGAEQTEKIILEYLSGKLRIENHFAILEKYLKPCMWVKSWNECFGGKAIEKIQTTRRTSKRNV